MCNTSDYSTGLWSCDIIPKTDNGEVELCTDDAKRKLNTKLFAYDTVLTAKNKENFIDKKNNDNDVKTVR